MISGLSALFFDHHLRHFVVVISHVDKLSYLEISLISLPHDSSLPTLFLEDVLSFKMPKRSCLFWGWQEMVFILLFLIKWGGKSGKRKCVILVHVLPCCMLCIKKGNMPALE